MFKIQALIGNELTVDQLIPEIERMQEKLRRISKEDLIKNTSAKYRNNKFFINAFFQEFEIDPNTFLFKNSECNPESIMMQSIILSYLTTSDGTPLSKQLISFRELQMEIIIVMLFRVTPLTGLQNTSNKILLNSLKPVAKPEEYLSISEILVLIFLCSQELKLR